MAMIVSTIANGGKLMKPYLVDKITNYAGTTVKKYMPESYNELMTSSAIVATIIAIWYGLTCVSP